MLRCFNTPYRQPDSLPNSAKISPIKPSHFSTDPSSDDRLAKALRTRNPRWTTKALWYPPAQLRRYLPNEGAPVGERDAPDTVSKAMPAVNRPAWASLHRNVHEAVPALALGIQRRNRCRARVGSWLDDRRSLLLPAWKVQPVFGTSHQVRAASIEIRDCQ